MQETTDTRPAHVYRGKSDRNPAADCTLKMVLLDEKDGGAYILSRFLLMRLDLCKTARQPTRLGKLEDYAVEVLEHTLDRPWRMDYQLVRTDRQMGLYRRGAAGAGYTEMDLVLVVSEENSPITHN